MKNPLDFIPGLARSRKLIIANAAGEWVSVPATEYAVLVTLANMPEPSHGPAIAEAADHRIPLPTVYSSLRRLQEKNCAVSEVKEFQIASAKVSRTLWRATATQLSQVRKDIHDQTPSLTPQLDSAVG